jgi:hypothetical protein
MPNWLRKAGSIHLRGESARFLQLHFSAMKRLTELDVLRGILLLMMVVNHSPSSLRRFTDQPVGFFTTAEAFVFVSAFLAGMLFRKRTALAQNLIRQSG